MKKSVYLMPALGLMGLIFWFSSFPAPDTVKRFPIFLGIKVVHLLEYGLLAYFWAWGLTRATTWNWRRVARLSILITFLWGISDELHQSFTPNRTARAADALTNLLAALLVIGALTFIRGRKAKLCYKTGVLKDEEVL